MDSSPKPPTSRKLLSWVPLVLHSALIWMVSSGPVPDFVREEMGAHDKLAHLGAYVAWGALCAWPLSRTLPSLGGVSRILLAGILGLTYGISDEIHQSFVPSRSADPWDAVVDGAGALLGALFFTMACKLSKFLSGARPPRAL